MEVLKTIGKGVLIFLFAVSILTAVSAFSMYQMTKMDNFEAFAVEGVSKLSSPGFSESELKAGIINAKKVCSETGNLPDKAKLEGFTAGLTCGDFISLKDGAGSAELASLVVKKEYNKDRGCSFLDCVNAAEGNERAFILIETSMANSFYNDVAMIFGALAVLFAVAYAALAGKASSALLGIGIPAVVVGFPSLLLEYAFKGAIINVFKGSQIIYQSTVGIFQSNLLYLFFAGMALLILGILAKPFEGRKEKRGKIKTEERNEEKEDEEEAQEEYEEDGEQEEEIEDKEEDEAPKRKKKHKEKKS